MNILYKNIGVVGSRDFKNKELVEETLFHSIGGLNMKIITGGARGVDTWAEEWAIKDCTPCEVIRPVNCRNKFDYLLRNVEIITKSDMIFAFWDGKSRGTKFVIDYAKARNKDIEIIKEAQK